MWTTSSPPWKCRRASFRPPRSPTMRYSYTYLRAPPLRRLIGRWWTWTPLTTVWRGTRAPGVAPPSERASMAPRAAPTDLRGIALDEPVGDLPVRVTVAEQVPIRARRLEGPDEAGD